MKQKKVRLPRLSRRGKLLCNLGTAVFLVLVSWVLLGCPAWTEAGALHRLERTLLLEPGTVRCRDDGVWWRDDTTVLVTGENYAYTAAISQEELFWYEVSSPLEYASLDEGPVLFGWTEPYSNDGFMERGTWLYPNPPEGAVGAELTILLEYELGDSSQNQDYEQGSTILSARGTLEDSGLMKLEMHAGTPREGILLKELFDGFGYETTEDGEPWRDCTITRADCRLELFDGDGGSMGERPVVWATEP